MKPFDEIRVELERRIDEARAQSQESFRTAPNSYGHGSDAGEVAALLNFRDWLLEEENE